MRILFITPYVPSPIRVRPYHFVRHLSRLHDVVVLTLWQSRREYQDLIALQEICPVVGVQLTRTQALTNCLRALPGREPLQGAYCRSSRLATLIKQTMNDSAEDVDSRPVDLRRAFDVVHIEHLRAAFVGSLVSHRTPALFDSVDCISLLLQRTARSSHSRRQRLLARLELARTRSYEARLLGQFDRVTATSPEDARALEELAPSTKVAVVPNGVDLEFFQPQDRPREPATLVLSGKMSYHANVTAALYFTARIFPLIKKTRPDARLQIVGSDPTDAIRALARDPAITVSGYLPDLREPLGRATVAICPVTVKVGIQNKVLEAMAMGVPVVSTVEGLEGLQAQPGRDLLVARNPAEFAAQVGRLLEDSHLRDEIGRAGRTYVQSHHRWDAAVAALGELYRDAIDLRTRSQRNLNLLRNFPPLE